MKIGILGSENSLYTNIVVKHFEDLKIEYFLILVKEKKEKESILKSVFKRFFRSKKYIGLSKFDPFTYKLIYKSLRYYKSKKYKELIKSYYSYQKNCKNIFFTPSVNHAQTLRFIQINKLDIGVFGGVGIVSDVIIKSFKSYCINAHPAPLPECRGGGALEYTLYNNLRPQISIHYATAEVDGGDVIFKKKLDLEKNDCFNNIHTKLLILCGKSLSEVITKMINNKQLNRMKNTGKLNFWKNCNKKIRIQGSVNLKKMLNDNNFNSE